MSLFAFLWRHSRSSCTLAALASIISGLSSAGLVALVTAAVDGEESATAVFRVYGFAALCVLFPLTTVLTQYLVARLTQGAVLDLRKDLVRRALATPLRRLEELGSHRLLTALAQDINHITAAINALPVLWINSIFVIGLVCYLAWLSLNQLLILVVAVVLAAVTYRIPARLAIERMRAVRRAGETLFGHYQALTGGTKELQIHARRRNSYLSEVDATAESLSRKNIIAVTLFRIAGSWSHFLILLAMGAILFVVPRYMEANPATTTTFVIVLLFLANIIQVIMDRVAGLGRANVSLGRLTELGLSLETPFASRRSAAVGFRKAEWQTLELKGVQHTYYREEEDESFTLGPINLSLQPGELVIVAGGNGSGKTTLAKLIIGLYSPERGEIRLDGRPVTAANLEQYRQFFSVVFADFHLFESLLGLESDELDEEAQEYLKKLHLERKVKIEDGAFSTTELSQGQRKRLALLTSYLEDRQIYLFDEWAADQDPYFKEIFYHQLLPELKARGKAVIAISHDEHYYDVADRVVRLDYGQIDDPSAEARPATARAAAPRQVSAEPTTRPLDPKPAGTRDRPRKLEVASMFPRLTDLRFGIRMLFKHPGHTVASILAFALGIGLTTAMFSIVNGALRTLPFEGAERLMHLESSNPSQGRRSMAVSLHDFLDWRDQQTSFEELAAFHQGTANIGATDAEPERYSGAFITANAFKLLGVEPVLGRSFQPGEDQPGSTPVAILGHGLWRNRFAGDPGVIGKAIPINGELMTVIGVMPEGFEFPVREDLWVPLRMSTLEIERGEGTLLEVFGRLEPGVSLARARAELGTITERLAATYPETNEGLRALIKPYHEEYVGARSIALLYNMLVAVLGVLLIACANVSNLLLARGAVRGKELAVRTALGAGRRQLIMQLLSEVFVLCAVGAILGLGLAFLGVELFNNMISQVDRPYWVDIKIDFEVLVFALAITFVATLIAGVVPAMKASKGDVNEGLKEEHRGTSSRRLGALTSALVVLEISLSCGLLVAAAMMTKSVAQLGQIDYGFLTEEVFTAEVEIFEKDYPDSESRLRFFEELRTRVSSNLGGMPVALTSDLPVAGSPRWLFALDGEGYTRNEDQPNAHRVVVTPEFFAALGVSLRTGREFSPTDREGQLSVAIVNESFAARFFPGRSVLGERIRFGGINSETERPWRTIVGLAPDLYMDGPDDEYPFGIYIPLAQTDAQSMAMVARTRGRALAIAPDVRRAVQTLDPNQPIFGVNSMAQFIEGRTWFYGVFGRLFVIFGAVALILATMGVYAVIAFSVRQRTYEMGIRLAFGARSGDVLKLLFKQIVKQVGIGVVLGLLLAFALSRALKAVLYQVEPYDPTVLLSVLLMIALSGALASLVPTLRAIRIDPIRTLRH